MKKYRSEVTIDASSDTVWAVLADGEKWIEWDPTLDRIEGTIADGEKIKVFSKLSPGRAFPVTVTEFVPGRKMTWTGGIPLGLFKGVRTFRIRPDTATSTRFAVEEVFSGPLLPLLGRSLPDMTEPFEQLTRGLKERAESLA